MDMVTPAGRRLVQFVGSVQLGSAEEVFTSIAATVGDCVRRIPDGETGDRSGWLSYGTRMMNGALIQIPIYWTIVRKTGTLSAG